MKWLIKWGLKLDESHKQELQIKSAVMEENCELSYKKIICANTKISPKIKVSINGYYVSP
jgi:hypothetical protein